MRIGRFERMLLIKIADLGDAAITLPAIHSLRKAYPQASLHVVSSPLGTELYRLSPDIDRCFVLEKSRLKRPPGALALARLLWTLRRQQYDAVALFHHLTTNAGRSLYQLLLAATASPVRAGLDNGLGTFLTHRVPDRGFGACPEWDYARAVVEALGASPQLERPRLRVPDAAFRRAQELIGDARDGLVVIHPGVGPFAPARRWPFESFTTVARELTRQGYQVVVTGTVNEEPEARPLLRTPGVTSLIGRTDLATLVAVLQQAKLVIGNDSGVTHLAAVLGRPTVAIFGPSNPDAWRPFEAEIVTPETLTTTRASVLALTAALPCAPCCYVGFRVGRPQGCSTRTCLIDLHPDVVLRAALQLLEEDRDSSW